MRKILITTKVLFLAVILSFVIGCGGGGSSSNSVILSEGARVIQGSWITDCIYEPVNDFYFRQEVNFNESSYSETLYAYPTSDCSGQSVQAYIGGDISYLGDFATGTCLAEKYDVTDITFELNGQVEAAPQEIYKGLACIYQDVLLTGTVVGEGDVRPDTMNLSLPFYKL